MPVPFVWRVSRPSRMVVDTGPAVTLIQEAVFWEATAAVDQPLLKLDTPIVVANGEELEIIGKTELVLQIGHTVKPAIVDTLK